MKVRKVLSFYFNLHKSNVLALPYNNRAHMFTHLFTFGGRSVPSYFYRGSTVFLYYIY